MTTSVVYNQLQMELITKVTEAMERNGWSQGDLERRSGVTQPNISNLLAGKRLGTLHTWNKLLRAIEAP
ncbi:helix-turn-helix DNA binding protein [Mycobacterium phage Tonenili]|uniref:Helix-turn-helix DNA binding domain protein n=1 Tax=Mycobacterium phage Tonenili TaxID=1891703 RepID=A0A1C9EH46_9CAUD|nr:helix-turn-helix DNA binding protein [Mycobacterium phage Tonenili]AON96824.1 helix-turn-helix DNA binding domain protein [Mycobacterium phage Tonenili]